MSKLKTNLVLILFFAFTTHVFAMEPEGKDTYVLKVGHKGLARMQYQSDLIAKETNEHIEKAGPLEGKRVLDVGCGFGIITEELAKRVGSTGHVFALDISPEQLAVAKERIAALGLENVTFMQHNAQLLSDFPERDFDLVYIRMVLAHVNNPESVISGAKDLLKDGGVIASQDITLSTFWEPHEEEIFVQVRDLGATMAKKTGNDYEIGERLQQLHEQVGFSKVEGYFRQPQLTVAEAKKLYLLGIAEVADKAIAAGFVSAETVENWNSTMSTWPEDDLKPFHMAKSGYVLAWK